MGRITNPLEEDPLLKALLKQLDRIETRRGFAKWKAQFLEQFEVHLEGTNVTKAGQKYHSFARRLDRLALLLKELEGLITAKECSPEYCSVKSRQSLSELQKHLSGLIQHTEALVPGTLEMERQAGYTKFDMGAVLVRDGFVEYDRLCICNEILWHMRDLTLCEVADKQLLQEMDRYWQKVQAFYEIMGTDLGLHGAIVKCREILRADDEEFYEMQHAEGEEEENGIVGNDDDDDDDEMDDNRTSSDLPSTSSFGGDLEDVNEVTGEIDNGKPSTSRRLENVEIYGLDLPLRLISIEDGYNLDIDSDDSSCNDLSSVSDYESWCWELELPEPVPKKKIKQSDSVIAEEEEARRLAKEQRKQLRQQLQQQQQEELQNRLILEQQQEQEKRHQAKNAITITPAPLLPMPKVERKAYNQVDEAVMTKKEKDEVMRYQWTGKDYYHGGSDPNSWRIAGSLKKLHNDKASDHDNDD